MRTDRFGIPESMFGRLDNDFYGAVGRIANLTALLENRLLTLYQALVNSQQDEHSKLPASEFISKSRAEVARLSKSGRLSREECNTITGFLERADELLDSRHDYVHNLWSAKEDGVVFGWRPSRHGKLKEDDRQVGIREQGIEQWYMKDARERPATEVLELVKDLVELNRRWDQTFALVSARRHASEDAK